MSLYTSFVMAKNAASKDILAAIERTGLTPLRSTLARWMRENYPALSARLAGRRTDWDALTKVFNNAGLTGRSGQPLNPEAVRKTWQRVKAAAEARSAGPDEPEATRHPSPPSSAPARDQDPLSAAASRIPTVTVSDKEPDPDEEEAELARRFGAKPSPRK